MTMSREFNREMGGYLRERGVFKKTNPLAATRRYIQGLIPKKKKQEDEMPLDIPPEQVEQVIAQDGIKTGMPRRLPAKQAAKPTVVAIAPQETKKQKVGIMKWFSSSKEQEDDYETVQQPAQPVIDEDVKEVLKITFKWLKQMDPETVDEIKASEDFEKYKKVLDKYGLIKR